MRPQLFEISCSQTNKQTNKQGRWHNLLPPSVVEVIRSRTRKKKKDVEEKKNSYYVRVHARVEEDCNELFWDCLFFCPTSYQRCKITLNVWETMWQQSAKCNYYSYSFDSDLRLLTAWGMAIYHPIPQGRKPRNKLCWDMQSIKLS